MGEYMVHQRNPVFHGAAPVYFHQRRFSDLDSFQKSFMYWQPQNVTGPMAKFLPGGTWCVGPKMGGSTCMIKKRAPSPKMTAVKTLLQCPTAVCKWESWDGDKEAWGTEKGLAVVKKNKVQEEPLEPAWWMTSPAPTAVPTPAPSANPSAAPTALPTRWIKTMNCSRHAPGASTALDYNLGDGSFTSTTISCDEHKCRTRAKVRTRGKAICH